MALETRRERAGRNQSLFREVNERIDDLAMGGKIEFICECDDAECAELVSL